MTRRLQLPDDIHVVVIEDYTSRVFLSVMHIHSLEHKNEFTVLKSKAHWSDLVHQYCELARKNYPRPLRHKSVSVHRQRIGL